MGYIRSQEERTESDYRGLRRLKIILFSIPAVLIRGAIDDS